MKSIPGCERVKEPQGPVLYGCAQVSNLIDENRAAERRFE